MTEQPENNVKKTNGSNGKNETTIPSASSTDPPVDPHKKIITEIRDAYHGAKDDGEKKRGRGRPPGSGKSKSKSKAPKFKADEKLFSGIVAFPFAYIAIRTGDDKWYLSPEETKELTHLTVVVINKHLPAILEAWGEEMALCGTLVAIIMKRRIS